MARRGRRRALSALPALLLVLACAQPQPVASECISAARKAIMWRTFSQWVARHPEVPGTLVAEREAVLTKKLQCEGHAALGELPGVTMVSAGSTVDEGSFRPFRVAVVSPPSAPSPPPPPPPPSPTPSPSLPPPSPSPPPPSPPAPIAPAADNNQTNPDAAADATPPPGGGFDEESPDHASQPPRGPLAPPWPSLLHPPPPPPPPPPPSAPTAPAADSAAQLMGPPTDAAPRLGGFDEEESESAPQPQPSTAVASSTVQGDGGPADERPAQQSGQGAGAQAEAPPAMFASLGQVDRFVLSKAGGYEKFDLHHPGTLQDALLARSYRNEIILLLSDMSFVDMTTNLVLNLAALGMEHYLVVATEPAVCMRFAAEGVVTGCAVSSVLSSLPASVWTTWDLPNQGKANLHLLWWQRWQLTAKVGELGYNVLVLDTDIAIHSDPYPHLKGDGLGRHNLVLQSEGGAFPSINVGLVYMQNVQRGSAALWVVREVADRILRRLQMAQPPVCKNGDINRHALWEQSVFNDVLESAVCACVARHRGAGCHFAHEASFLAHFDAAARDEFVWKLGPERTRPTPTTDPWVLGLYKEHYRVRWMPLFTAPAELNPDTLNMTLTLNNDGRPRIDPHTPLPQPEEEEPPPPSAQDTVGASPAWLFSLVAETSGWLAVQPGPTVITHMVVLGPAKRAYMRALGMWDPRASFRRDAHTKFLQLGGAPLAPETREQMHAAVARLSALAVATGRLPVMPLVPCDSVWIGRSGAAYHGIRDHEVVAAPCAASQVCCHFIPALDRCGSDRVQYPTEMAEHLSRNARRASLFTPVRMRAREAGASGPGGAAVTVTVAELARSVLGGGALVVELQLEAAAGRNISSGAEIPAVNATGHAAEKRLVEFFMACKFMRPAS